MDLQILHMFFFCHPKHHGHHYSFLGGPNVDLMYLSLQSRTTLKRAFLGSNMGFIFQEQHRLGWFWQNKRHLWIGLQNECPFVKCFPSNLAILVMKSEDQRTFELVVDGFWWLLFLLKCLHEINILLGICWKLGQQPTIARLSMNLLKLFKIYCALCECFKEVLLLIEHNLPPPKKNTSAPFANLVFGHIRTMPFWSQRKHSKKNGTDQLIHLNVATNESGPVASSCAKCGHLIPALMEDLQ